MTVTEKASRRVISGFGWTNPLTHTFELENSTHLKVYADDVELVLGVDYSITGVGVDSGYSVTITDPLDWSPDVWVLSVEPPINQADDVSLGGVFGARFEESLDAMARRVQRVWNGVQRSWKVPMTTAVGEAPTMDVLAEGHFWKADADGNMIDGGSAADISGAQGWAASAAASALAAASSAVNAAASAALAALLAAGLSLPAISAGAKHKVLKVKADETGYRHSRNPLYDPYDYGALGNGVTDDTAKLIDTQTAANANEGIQATPKGRGVLVLPPGNFITNAGVTTQNTREQWMGLGGTLTCPTLNTTTLTVAHGACVIENFIIVNNATRPTAAFGVVKHSSGPDCTFRKLLIGGGYYGIEAVGGGDSVWMDCKVVGAYSDFVYLHGYNGFWGIRNKFDGDWPSNSLDGFGVLRTHPIAAEILGAWATGTPVVVGQVMYANGYYFQCSKNGTTAASGTGPVAALKGTAVVDNTAEWKTHRTLQSAGVQIESDCFINVMWMTDITGGHINSVRLNHTVGSNRPQTVKFLDGCEFGVPLSYGLLADWADDVELGSIVIDNVINSTLGTGVVTNNVRGIDVHNNMIRQHQRGVSIGPATTGASIDHNSFGGIAGWCIEFQAGVVGFQAIGNKCGGSPWGANGNGIRVLAGASDEYIVALNRGHTIVGTRWSDGGTGFNKVFGQNV